MEIVNVRRQPRPQAVRGRCFVLGSLPANPKSGRDVLGMEKLLIRGGPLFSPCEAQPQFVEIWNLLDNFERLVQAKKRRVFNWNIRLLFDSIPLRVYLVSSCLSHIRIPSCHCYFHKILQVPLCDQILLVALLKSFALRLYVYAQTLPRTRVLLAAQPHQNGRP